MLKIPVSIRFRKCQRTVFTALLLAELRGTTRWSSRLVPYPAFCKSRPIPSRFTFLSESRPIPSHERPYPVLPSHPASSYYMEIILLSQKTVDKGSRDGILPTLVQIIHFTSRLFENSLYLE